MIADPHVIVLSMLLFGIGAVGAVTRRNLIVILMCIELMLGAVNLAFVGFGRMWSASLGPAAAMDGQIFALMVMGVAAGELAVGLAILIALVRNRDSLSANDVSLLRW